MPRGVECRQPLGSAPVAADLPKRIPKIGGKHNYVFRTPGAASPTGSIGENGHGSASGRDLSQFAVGEKRNELYIRRPERKSSVFGAIQLSGNCAVQDLNIQSVRSFAEPCGEDHPCAV